LGLLLGDCFFKNSSGHPVEHPNAAHLAGRRRVSAVFVNVLHKRLASTGCAFDSTSGLQDGLFSNQKFQFWQILDGLKLKDWKMPIYFMPIWNILLRFGKFYGHVGNFAFISYIFPVFGIT
jgi:hypothetical protein